MSDLIHLIEVQLQCRVGVPVEERRSAQPIVVDLTIEADLRTAALSESVADTIDYAAVLTAMEEVAQRREWVLIESVAEEMCAAVMARFPAADGVRVLLRKPEALRSRGVAFAAVEIERRR